MAPSIYTNNNQINPLLKGTTAKSIKPRPPQIDKARISCLSLFLIAKGRASKEEANINEEVLANDKDTSVKEKPSKYLPSLAMLNMTPSK